ncbi:enoyl-CoA hydratase-related protein [Nioella sediminis]|jgi:2-(1,2-epoxy-1,2-dihydrophenyl)acetyl-CoA isomerase|uniref:enoyl-CoA hydratase-related protein n=1 Tax=Nioella sediminis TaxID=1912092 RepID=UPI0008FD15BA|nr:enoyl-CoA hydratase-related protein [Nioella sediminis]TBX28104.1 enoyl-CoA hydratase [Roseovarius sp. JS7-11]
MDYQTLTSDLHDGVAVITLRRPDVMNSFNTQMRAELCHAVQMAGQAARVGVITGEGRAFSAGQDLGDTGNLNDLNLEKLLRDEYSPILRAIAEVPIPIIAAVNGVAAGAGANIALACDVVIAAESASFMQAFSKIGLIPDAGGTYTLPRKVGFAKAMGLALFAEKLSAREADEMGLIWEAVDDASFEAHWRARAQHLASGPTQAFSRIKQAMRDSLGNDLEDQLMLEARLQGQAGKSRDFKEGVLAFLEKRPAHFEGR